MNTTADDGNIDDAGRDGSANHSLFRAGELALFLDRKGRTYQEALTPGGEFHCHLGWIAHDEVIGKPVGGWYTTSRGHVLLGIRPTLGDYVRLMPRGPQVIYAKDLGNIVAMADIFPGATVAEAGFGSGALTTALLRAVGPTGARSHLRNQRGRHPQSFSECEIRHPGHLPAGGDGRGHRRRYRGSPSGPGDT